MDFFREAKQLHKIIKNSIRRRHTALIFRKVGLRILSKMVDNYMGVWAGGLRSGKNQCDIPAKLKNF
jgi:hypothetical protein